MKPINIAIVKLNDDATLPTYARDGDAGMDLYASHQSYIMPGSRELVGTGIAMAIPYGYVGLIHPRSGLAVNYGLTVLNTPGTVDSGYRGEIKVCIMNTDRQRGYMIAKGERIAQIVFQKVEHAMLEEVEQLPDSDRGVGGFGSTGDK